jgi:hypothetical protein
MKSIQQNDLQKKNVNYIIVGSNVSHDSRTFFTRLIFN